MNTIMEEPKGDKIIKLLQKENGVKNDKYQYIKDIYNDFFNLKKILYNLIIKKNDKFQKS